MFNRFNKGANQLVTDAVEIAHELGSTTVEAEHLLLAASRLDDRATAVLRGHGLDYAGLEAALAAETERSLAAVGVAATSPSFTRFASKPRFATSAKVTLEQSLRIASERRDRQINAGHVVLAALRPSHGTVPRTLTLAGVDREALRAEISSAM